MSTLCKIAITPGNYYQHQSKPAGSHKRNVLETFCSCFPHKLVTCPLHTHW